MTAKHIVRVAGVTKNFDLGKIVVEVLKGIDLVIETGKYISIMGPSGSGKSTLFNMIGGLDKPTGGKVFIDEVDIAQLDAYELAWLRCRKIGYIFQTFNLIPVMTALENVTIPMTFAGVSGDDSLERGMELLELVGLAGRHAHRPSELSGGQQQRVAVARALANNPSIILADEPTGNLDLKTGEDIISLLKDLSSSYNVTVISATHDYKMLNVSDQVVWIRDGRIDKIQDRSELEIQTGGLRGHLIIMTRRQPETGCCVYRFPRQVWALLLCVLLFSSVLWSPSRALASTNSSDPGFLESTIRTMASYGGRQTGSEGSRQAADFIEEEFGKLGLHPVSHLFGLPIRKVKSANLVLRGASYPLHPFLYNAITPGATNGTISGPLYYAGHGSFAELDGKKIAGSVILMDFESGRNWQRLASLGAKALIYLDRGTTRSKFFFREKEELSPVQFPCFWMPADEAQKIFGDDLSRNNGRLAEKVELSAAIRWQNVTARNIYAIIPGADSKKKDSLLIITAFFDNRELINGVAPGADSATSIATLLDIARALVAKPPDRSVMLIATSGHAQTLAGMRELMWSLDASARELHHQRRDLRGALRLTKTQLRSLTSLSAPPKNNHHDATLTAAIGDDLRFTIDALSRQLMRLRLTKQTASRDEEIKRLAAKRFALRQLSWTTDYSEISQEQTHLLQQLAPQARHRLRLQKAELENQLRNLKSAQEFRSTVREYDVAAIVSLHLSSHGNGVGGFYRGWLYNLKQTVNRTGIYSAIAEVLQKSASGSNNGTLVSGFAAAKQDAQLGFLVSRQAGPGRRGQLHGRLYRHQPGDHRRQQGLLGNPLGYPRYRRLPVSQEAGGIDRGSGPRAGGSAHLERRQVPQERTLRRHRPDQPLAARGAVRRLPGHRHHHSRLPGPEPVLCHHRSSRTVSCPRHSRQKKRPR